MTDRGRRASEILRQLAAQYLSVESNRTSLITVTDVDLSMDGKKATILITVMPVDASQNALNFVKRKRSDFRSYVKKNSRLKRLPYFDFAIDEGEKNRRRIDELLNESR